MAGTGLYADARMRIGASYELGAVARFQAAHGAGGLLPAGVTCAAERSTRTDAAYAREADQ
jgi:hypothetical protein